jgi:hypothetical protein
LAQKHRIFSDTTKTSDIRESSLNPGSAAEALNKCSLLFLARRAGRPLGGPYLLLLVLLPLACTASTIVVV